MWALKGLRTGGGLLLMCIIMLRSVHMGSNLFVIDLFWVPYLLPVFSRVFNRSFSLGWPRAAPSRAFVNTRDIMAADAGEFFQ